MGTYGQSRMEQNQTILDTTTALAAVNATTLDTAFDPFTGRTNPAIMAKIADTAYEEFTKQQLKEVSAKADGSLFTWSGGTVRGAIGAQIRDEEVTATYRRGPNTNLSERAVTATRQVKAVYGEVLVPFAQGEGALGLRRLDLSLAGRLEDYDSFGRTTNPKVGVNWSPMLGLQLRASYGTSFRAPALTDIASVANSVQVLPNTSSPGTLTPPGSPPLNVLNIIGGNPRLGPENSTSKTFGVDLAPTWLSGFRASVTHFRIHYDNVIAGAAGRFTNPALAFTYILNPTEAQIDDWTRGLTFAGVRFQPGQTGIIVDSRTQNLAVRVMRGLDYEVSQRWSTSWGDFLATLGGTHLSKYTSQATVTSPAVDQLTAVSNVKDRVRGSLVWRNGGWAAGLAGNYTGPYWLITPAQRVKPFFTVDFNASWEPPLSGVLADTTLSLNVQNLFDEDPPVYLASPGFDTARANPLGRLITISLGKRF